VHYGFPYMVRAANGALLLFYRVGQSHASDAAVLALRMSRDRGRTWSAERIVHRDPRPTHGAHNPTAVVTPSGRVILFVSAVGWQTNPIVRDSLLWSWSDDHGESWAKFERFDPSADRSTYYMTDAIATQGGLLTVAATFPPSGIGPCWNLFWHSEDGRAWRVLTALTQPEENRGDEIGLMETAPGVILALHRARRRPGESGYPKALWRRWSRDNGRTWSEPENLYEMLGRCILQKPLMTRLDATTILLAGRDQERKLVVAYVSRDNGQTFGERHVIDAYVADGAYTSSVAVEPGHAVMAYYTDVAAEPGKPDILQVSVKLSVTPRRAAFRAKGRAYLYFDGPEWPEQRTDTRVPVGRAMAEPVLVEERRQGTIPSPPSAARSPQR
jgi:hypothetical protein